MIFVISQKTFWYRNEKCCIDVTVGAFVGRKWRDDSSVKDVKSRDEEKVGRNLLYNVGCQKSLELDTVQCGKCSEWFHVHCVHVPSEVVEDSSVELLCSILFVICTSKVTAPQDAHRRLVLQVYLGSNTLEFSAIHR